MSNFTPAERVEVDNQYRILAKALHELDPAHATALRSALTRAESGSTDPTLARVLVAAEILRGVAWEGRAPLTIRDYAMPGELAAALSDAEQLGRAIGPHATTSRSGLLSLLRRPRKSFSHAGKRALMHCRAIGAAHQRRQAARRPSKGVRRA